MNISSTIIAKMNPLMILSKYNDIFFLPDLFLS